MALVPCMHGRATMSIVQDVISRHIAPIQLTKGVLEIYHNSVMTVNS